MKFSGLVLLTFFTTMAFAEKGPEYYMGIMELHSRGKNEIKAEDLPFQTGIVIGCRFLDENRQSEIQIIGFPSGTKAEMKAIRIDLQKNTLEVYAVRVHPKLTFEPRGSGTIPTKEAGMYRFNYELSAGHPLGNGRVSGKAIYPEKPSTGLFSMISGTMSVAGVDFARFVSKTTPINEEQFQVLYKSLLNTPFDGDLPLESR